MPHPIYTNAQNIDQNQSSPQSPTPSVIIENIANELNFLEKNDFQVDKKYLHDDFYASHNKEKVKWFFKKILNTGKETQEEFYKFVLKHKFHILFFDYFEIFAYEKHIAYTFKSIKLVTIKKKVHVWETPNCEVEAEHPLLIQINFPYNNQKVKACPLKKPQDDSSTNLKNIILIFFS